MAGPVTRFAAVPYAREQENFPQVFWSKQKKGRKRPSDDSEVLSIVFAALQKMSEERAKAE